VRRQQRVQVLGESHLAGGVGDAGEAHQLEREIAQQREPVVRCSVRHRLSFSLYSGNLSFYRAYAVGFKVAYSLRQHGMLRFCVAGFSPQGEKPAT
jgi:hypothetical protein